MKKFLYDPNVFTNDCNEVSDLDPVFLDKLIRNFESDVMNQIGEKFVSENRFSIFNDDIKQKNEEFTIFQWDDCILIKNSKIQIKLFSGKANDYSFFLIIEPVGRSSNNEDFPLKNQKFQLISNWVDELLNFVDIPKEQLHFIQKVLSKCFEQLVVSVQVGKFDVLKNGLMHLKQLNTSLSIEKSKMLVENEVIRKELNKEKDYSRYLKERLDLVERKFKAWEALNRVYMEQEIRRLIKNIDVLTLISGIDFPKSQENYRYSRYPGNYSHTEVTSIRNNSIRHFLSYFQGDVILNSQVYDWHLSGPCDTPGEVLSHNYYFRLVHKKEFQALDLNEDVVTFLEFRPLREFMKT